MRLCAVVIIGLGLSLACGIGPAGAQTQTSSAQPASPIADMMKSAFQTAKAQCAEFVAPYRSGALQGKIALLDEPITDAMKANEDIPSEGEAVILRGFIAADAKCTSVELAYVREYMPWYVPAEEYTRDALEPIYAALAARQVSWGKANRDIDNVAIHTKELRKLAVPTTNNGPAFVAAQREKDQKCQAIYAAVSDRSVGGKLLTGAALTPAALVIRARVTDVEAATVRSIRAAHDACARLNIEVTKTYIPWYLPVIQEEQSLDDDVFTALANGHISFGEANKRFADIAVRIKQDGRKLVEDLTGKPAPQTPAPQTAQASSPPSGGPQTASATPAKPLTAGQLAYQEVGRRCEDAIGPFRKGPLAGKIRMSHETITPALLGVSDIPTEAEASLLADYVGAYALCQAYETKLVATYLSWMMPAHDRQVQRERPVFDDLIARKLSYGEANRRLKEIEQDAMAESDKLAAARKSESGEMQAFGRMLQPGNN